MAYELALGAALAAAVVLLCCRYPLVTVWSWLRWPVVLGLALLLLAVAFGG